MISRLRRDPCNPPEPSSFTISKSLFHIYPISFMSIQFLQALEMLWLGFVCGLFSLFSKCSAFPTPCLSSFSTEATKSQIAGMKRKPSCLIKALGFTKYPHSPTWALGNGVGSRKYLGFLWIGKKYKSNALLWLLTERGAEWWQGCLIFGLFWGRKGNFGVEKVILGI